jgi:hypothetical protein
MTKNVTVTSNGKENSMGLLKKFSQKMRSSGVVPRLKSVRYNERDLSFFKKKNEKLRKIEKLASVERDLKLGKKPKRR